jgi:hypothetical protein
MQIAAVALNSALLYFSHIVSQCGSFQLQFRKDRSVKYRGCEIHPDEIYVCGWRRENEERARSHYNICAAAPHLLSNLSGERRQFATAGRALL